MRIATSVSKLLKYQIQGFPNKLESFGLNLRSLFPGGQIPPCPPGAPSQLGKSLNDLAIFFLRKSSHRLCVDRTLGPDCQG